MESYAAGETSPALLEETIGANFERTVAAHGDSEALVEVASGRRWTYAELDRDVNALARGLIAAGSRRATGSASGRRTAPSGRSCSTPPPRSARSWSTSTRPTAPTSSPTRSTSPGCGCCSAPSRFKTSDYRAMVEEVWDRVSTSSTDGAASSGSSTSAPTTGTRSSRRARTSPRTPSPQRMATLEPGDPINIQYTSGTTGYPKGATLSHRNILNNGFFTTETINFTARGPARIPVPFYHCFGMVMGNLGCTTHGATMVIPAPGFDPAVTLRAVQRSAAPGCTASRRCSSRCRTHPAFADHDLSRLRTGIMAGSICPVEVMKRCVNDMHMAEVSIAYGMTETSPVSCQTRADDDLDRRTATIGRVHPHVEIKIVDPATGETVERGETGEFCTRGYCVMVGYWDDPEKTDEAIDADGWMHTGDLAVMREDGYCNIVGRIKDMVIRGGENIYPREIEEFLYTHPDIEDVQVIGVPDERYGEELCAWVKMRAGAEPLDADAVREFATGKLAHYKIPRYVMVVDEFPMTVTGKIRKVQMREESAEQLGLA